MTTPTQISTTDLPSRKVYITNNSGYPYDKAEQFGELIYLTQGNINFTKIDSILKRIANIIDTATSGDYLLISGNNFICTVTASLWVKKHGFCRMLHWNPIKKEYNEYPINFGMTEE